jgi:hypothetical protein
MTEFKEIHDDIAAFADDDEDVVIDPSGGCLFVRGGKETQLLFSQVDDKLLVEVEGQQLPYSKFLTHHLAQLDTLAERILAKRESVEPYIDSSVVLKSSMNDEQECTALEALDKQTRTSPAFLSTDPGQALSGRPGQLIVLARRSPGASAFTTFRGSYG